MARSTTRGLLYTTPPTEEDENRTPEPDADGANHERAVADD
jgi:hypothetical protein